MNTYGKKCGRTKTTVKITTAFITNNIHQGFRWLHDSFGTNWRMMEMQAVIGRIQLQRMPEWTQKRTEHAQRILAAFQDSPYFTVHYPNSDYVHANYKCYVQVNSEQLPAGWSRDRIMQEINALNVPCFSGSCSEVYLEHAFDGTAWRPAQRLVKCTAIGRNQFNVLGSSKLKR